MAAHYRERLERGFARVVERPPEIGPWTHRGAYRRCAAGGLPDVCPGRRQARDVLALFRPVTMGYIERYFVCLVG